MPTQPFQIPAKPGIRRDGTEFDGDYHTNGEWVRWQRGRARKIGGWRNVVSGWAGPFRGLNLATMSGYSYIHSGSPSYLQACQIQNTGTGGGIYDRTPAGFVASANNLWQFDQMWDATSTSMRLIAHAAPNLLEIDNATTGTVWFGNVFGTSALTTTGQSVSGGVIVLHPYLFIFSSDGLVSWSDANKPDTFAGGDSGSARVCATKLVRGLVSRGGSTNAPAGLLWSLDSLIRVSYVGSPSIFRFDTITDQTSVLSSNCMIEYDGVFYWIARDRFQMYNGVVQDLPNNMNLNYFFDGLNYTYRQKIWATKIQRYNEIWWFYPRGTATECTHAIIYNIRENTWYDTPIPRAAGIYSQVYQYPLWGNSVADAAGTYSLYQHEFGWDAIDGQQIRAINSYYETSDISWLMGGPNGNITPEDRWVEINRLEPDFVQNGGMTLTVLGRKYARSDPSEVAYSFDPDTEKVDIRAQFRELRLRFDSNTEGGTYQAGRNIIHLGPGDGRQ